jgi:hypothetical protein
MTLLDTREQPQTVPQDGGDDLEHVVCCIDDNTTMCGLTIEGDVNEVDEFDDSESWCLVCTDLAKQQEYYADLFGEDPQLPGDVPCRVCPKRRRDGAS